MSRKYRRVAFDWGVWMVLWFTAAGIGTALHCTDRFDWMLLGAVVAIVGSAAQEGSKAAERDA